MYGPFEVLEKVGDNSCWVDLVVYIPQHLLSIRIRKIIRHGYNMCRTSLEIS
jgi:hypothetical protein